MGSFHSIQNSGNYRWYIKWNGPFRFGPTEIFGTSFEGDPLWPVWSFRPFSFDKTVVPSTALLYPAYKNKNQTRSGLGRVCATGMYHPLGTWNFRNFKPEFLLNRKRHRTVLGFQFWPSISHNLEMVDRRSDNVPLVPWCSGYGYGLYINWDGLSPTYCSMFSSIFFLLLFTTLSYKTPIMYFEWRWQSDFGVSVLVTTLVPYSNSAPHRSIVTCNLKMAVNCSCRYEFNLIIFCPYPELCGTRCAQARGHSRSLFPKRSSGKSEKALNNR